MFFTNKDNHFAQVDMLDKYYTISYNIKLSDIYCKCCSVDIRNSDILIFLTQKTFECSLIVVKITFNTN